LSDCLLNRELEFLLEDSGYLVCPGCYHPTHSLPVVSCLLEFCHGGAMTRIGYDKPTDVSTSSRPSRPPPDTWILFLTPTILFQTSADFKVSRRYLYRLAQAASSQVWSLSAPSSFDVTNTVPPISLLAHRFSQPPGKDDVRNDLRVYSTPQALLGS
jgi:hypothetical protein